MIAENVVLMSLPSAIYAVVVRLRSKLAASEIAARLGLIVGRRRPYLVALVAAVPLALLGAWFSTWTSGFTGSMIAPFVQATPSTAVIGSALAYGVLATGFPEEVLFRGLIAGAFFRRTSFWKANLSQAFIFTLPHLLILFVAPQLWPLATLVPMGLGLLVGWLRHSSGSIGPGVIVHAASNLGGAFAVMSWGSVLG